MTLKEIIAQKLLNDVIKDNRPPLVVQPGQRKKIQWRVLVVDKFSMRLVSECKTMHELCEEGITLVEDIRKKREPLPTMDAVYLITPCESSIRSLISDFETRSQRLYKSAYVFFTDAVPDVLFDMIQGQKVVKYMKACKEINIAVVANESQVFSLDSPETFQFCYSPSFKSRSGNMERIAEQIASLCVTLGEYPSIRYRSDWKRNGEVAELVQRKLDAYKVGEPTLGEGSEKAKSILLILDRGFDCVSPILHELTLQAMAYDLLPIANDVYKYESQGVEKEVLLGMNDLLWRELRHQHIAVVSEKVTAQLKDLALKDKLRPTPSSENTGNKTENSMRELSSMIKNLPEHQKNISKYTTHLSLAEDCMKVYKERNIAQLCKVEQDLAMGVDDEGEEIKDHFRNSAPILLESIYSTLDKVRIIALYVMIKNGVSMANFDKVTKHANIEDGEREIILNLANLGVNVITDNNTLNQKYKVPRKDRIAEQIYETSRWTPVVKDVMETCIDEKLDENQFPYQFQRAGQKGAKKFPTSARYGHWNDKPQQINNNLPRLIVFVVGGVSYSEMRCAYEVNKAKASWEVIIGSSHILTPESFLTDLGALSKGD